MPEAVILTKHVSSTCSAQYNNVSGAENCEAFHRRHKKVIQLETTAKVAHEALQKVCSHKEVTTHRVPVNICDNYGYEDQHRCNHCDKTWTITRY